MERLLNNSIYPLAYGSFAEGGATVDSHLMALCRPHHKPPPAMLPVGTYVMPLPQGSSPLCREVHDIHFAPHDPSLLLACTSDDVLLAFDMNAGAFFSEIQLSAGSANSSGSPKGMRSTSCVHVNRNPMAPLVFAGTMNGEVLIFDTRTSSLSGKLSRGFCPALRLTAAHSGAVCGIRTDLALQQHVFLTGGRDDRWLRLFDIRFPFHYTSGGSGCQSHVPFPLEATCLGPPASEDGPRTSIMAFDISPDGSLLAASVSRCRRADPSADASLVGEDGETIVLSLRDNLRTLKTIASADACAAEFIQFSPNGKYILQTGGVRAAHCKRCWRCTCACFCASGEGHYCNCASNGSKKSSVVECTQKLPWDAVPDEDGLSKGHPSSFVRPCAYHRAQLVNLIQSNRTVNLKSPADGSVAFVDSFCLSHSPRLSQSLSATAPVTAPHAAPGGCGGLLSSQTAATGGLLSRLNFTLHGPRSSHVQRSRRRFWDYLSELQNPSMTRRPEARQVISGEVAQRTHSALLLPVTQSGEARNEDFGMSSQCDSGKPPSKQSERSGDGLATNAGKVVPREEVGADANSTVENTGCLLFPLLHPQLSQFIAACGPLHPAFVRAEAATSPFTCRLWGGLVVGFGGSTTDNAGRRLYQGLKLWDSTTGVVLSWTEGYLALEDNLRCLAPVPDVSTGLLATGGSLPPPVSNSLRFPPQDGLTFWSLRRRDDLLISALEGSLFLQVNLRDDDTNEVSLDAQGKLPT